MLFKLLMVMELLLMGVLQLELLVLLVSVVLMILVLSLMLIGEYLAQWRQILLMMWLPSSITSASIVFNCNTLMLPRIKVIVLLPTHQRNLLCFLLKKKCTFHENKKGIRS